jgi:Lon protease-like protein
LIHREGKLMDFPSVLRVFPLTGCILLPGNWLPHHVFEPRYRNLVSDVLREDGWVGMIQPLIPAEDNVAPRNPVRESPELYRVGGLGKIERCILEADGRYQILLRGIVRFRTLEELSVQREYRRFRVVCSEFAGDLREGLECWDPSRLIGALKEFSRRCGLSLDPRSYCGLSGCEMINGLSAALPLPPAEKQALLEAPDLEERLRRLLMILGMGPDGIRSGAVTTSPTEH